MKRSLRALVALGLLCASGAAPADAQQSSPSSKTAALESAAAQVRLLNQTLARTAPASGADARPESRDQILALLKQRAALLTHLIQQSPAQALALQLSADARTQLAVRYPVANDLIESAGTWIGRLEVVAEDDRQTGEARTVHVVTGARGAFEVHFVGSVPPRAAGNPIRVTGMRLGAIAVATEWQYDAAPPAADAACATTGEQRVAVILVSFPGKPLLSAITQEMMRQTYFGTGLSLDTYLKETSGGKASATGQVFGPVILDADYYGQPTAVRDAALRAAAGLADFTSFTRIALIVPQASTGLASGGMGTIGCSDVALSNGSVNASTTWLGDVSMGSEADRVATAVHEMGHNLGLQHARAADFGDEPLAPIGQVPAPWDQTRDYGDVFSNMGRNLGHWAAPHKLLLGWLQSGTEVLDVEATSSYTLRPYEESAGGLKAIRVRRGSGNNAWLWIENRQAIGTYDAGLPSSAFTGAIIHYTDSGWGDSALATNLLRFNPDAGLFFGAAPLAAGRSWSDPYTNLTLAVTRGESGVLTIAVSYAPTPACPATLTPAATRAAAAGATASITVTAPSDCAWTASSPASWITFTSSTSGVGNGQVSFTVSATSTTADRWSSIAVGAAVATVTQAGLAGNVSLTPSSATFAAAGGDGVIAVATNTPDYAWSYTSQASWIRSIFPSRVGTIGPATLRYIVAQNTSESARTGTIDVGGQTLTITQAAGIPSVSRFVWTQTDLANAPSSRHHMASAPLGNTGHALLYGGTWNTTYFTDTWIWDGATWADAHPAHTPGPLSRAGAAMAYDETRQEAVLFGGWIGATGEFDNSTWVWSGSDWIERRPAHAPPGRSSHAMVYHAASGRIVLFGGFGAYGDLNDTWEWDGSDWVERVSASTPAARNDHAMTYDAARGEVVVFGGTTSVAPQAWFQDTWAWDGKAWHQRASASGPTPRSGAGMAYHPGLGLVILVGGSGYLPGDAGNWAFDYREEAWAWNGTVWTQMYPDVSPPFSWSYAMWYDPGRAALVAHIGDDLHCASRGPKIFSLTAGPGAIQLSPYGADSLAVGMHGSFAVASGVAWAATTAESWIAVASGMTGSGNGTVDYDVLANTSAEARRGNIDVGGQVFSIRQAGAAIVVPGAPGAFTKHPATNAEGAVTLSWAISAAAVSYEYCIARTADGVCAGEWTNVGTPNFANVSTLPVGATLWWQVRARNSVGVTEADGGTWSSLSTYAGPRQGTLAIRVIASQADMDAGHFRVEFTEVRSAAGDTPFTFSKNVGFFDSYVSPYIRGGAGAWSFTPTATGYGVTYRFNTGGRVTYGYDVWPKAGLDGSGAISSKVGVLDLYQTLPNNFGRRGDALALDYETVTLTFDVPSDMDVYAPWRPLGAARTYLVHSRTSPTYYNYTLGLATWGRYTTSRHLTVGDHRLSMLAVDTNADALFDRYAQWYPYMLGAFSAANSDFLPPQQTILMLGSALDFANGGTTLGGSYNHETSFFYESSFSGPAHGITHHTLGWPVFDESFEEGLATYYQNVLNYRFGIWSESQFTQSVNGMLRYYLDNVAGQHDYPLRRLRFDYFIEDDTLVVDPTIAQDLTTFLEYPKGMLVWTAIDQIIKRSSGGSKELIDFFRELYADYLGNFEYQWDYTEPRTYDAVMFRLSAMTGQDFYSFFDRFFFGAEPLPLRLDGETVSVTFDEPLSFRLISPSGGERWQAGATREVVWTPIGTAATVDIDYSLDGGATWATLVAGTANDGRHPWTLPQVGAQSCLVRVTPNGAAAVSSKSFSIVMNAAIEFDLSVQSLPASGVAVRFFNNGTLTTNLERAFGGLVYGKIDGILVTMMAPQQYQGSPVSGWVIDGVWKPGRTAQAVMNKNHRAVVFYGSVAPSVTMQPSSQSTVAGATVRFTAEGIGSPMPTVIWQSSVDGGVSWKDIQGATAVSHIVTVSSSDRDKRFRAVFTNAEGSTTTDAATLSLSAITPTIAWATPAAITAGTALSAAQLNATASEGGATVAGAFVYTPAAGAVLGVGIGQTLSVTFTPTDTTTYVTVTKTVSIDVTNQAAARTLPVCYAPGYAVAATVAVVPAPSVQAHALADQPPAGWTLGAISDGGIWDATTSQIKWGPFFDAAARMVTYLVTPPADASGVATFAGVASFDGGEVPTGGTRTLARCELHPADANGDGRLVISEVTGYGAAWKKGTTWVTPPTSIPIGYLTRAGYLWKTGETYRRDSGPTAAACPTCWVPLTAAPLPIPEMLLMLEPAEPPPAVARFTPMFRSPSP